jgi:hypothetical protein
VYVDHHQYVVVVVVRTWTKQSWKKSRRMEAPMRCSLAMAACITDLAASYTPGHEEE